MGNCQAALLATTLARSRLLHRVLPLLAQGVPGCIVTATSGTKLPEERCCIIAQLWMFSGFQDEEERISLLLPRTEKLENPWRICCRRTHTALRRHIQPLQHNVRIEQCKYYQWVFWFSVFLCDQSTSQHLQINSTVCLRTGRGRVKLPCASS